MKNEEVYMLENLIYRFYQKEHRYLLFEILLLNKTLNSMSC